MLERAHGLSAIAAIDRNVSGRTPGLPPQGYAAELLLGHKAELLGDHSREREYVEPGLMVAGHNLRPIHLNVLHALHFDLYQSAHHDGTSPVPLDPTVEPETAAEQRADQRHHREGHADRSGPQPDPNAPKESH